MGEGGSSTSSQPGSHHSGFLLIRSADPASTSHSKSSGELSKRSYRCSYQLVLKYVRQSPPNPPSVCTRGAVSSAKNPRLNHMKAMWADSRRTASSRTFRPRGPSPSIGRFQRPSRKGLVEECTFARRLHSDSLYVRLATFRPVPSETELHRCQRLQLDPERSPDSCVFFCF